MTSDLRDAPTASTEPESGRPAGSPDYEFEPHNCFACGELNEHGLRLKLHLGERRSWADFVLDDRFEGWAGIIHGGIIATILDEVMAWALVAEDNWGVTARMAIDFKRRSWSGRRSAARAGSSDRDGGWSTRPARSSTPTAVVLATAEAVYAAAGEERKRELMAQYGVRIRNARATGAGISK